MTHAKKNVTVNNYKHGIKNALILSIFVTLFLPCKTIAAVQCVSGCNGATTNTLSKSLGMTDNEIGKSFMSSPVTTLKAIIYNNLGDGGGDWLTYGGDPIPPAGVKSNDWNYNKVDDYISVALRYKDNCREVFGPFNIRTLNQNTCKTRNSIPGQRYSIVPRTYTSRIRVEKKIIGGSYSKKILLAEFGKNEPFGSTNKDVVVTRVYLNIDVSAPQNCVVNSGEIIDINFGSVLSSSFKIAGAKPENVNPKSSVIGLECTNIDSQANLTMRVQADSVSGNAIVSNDKNVGFVIADVNNRELTPNLLSSFIPFKLDDSARANVTIRVYPVSVTGKKPNEGIVTSLAYLRVDFE